MTDVVVLDRAGDLIPEYSVYGLIACVACTRLCYLGHNTARTVMAGTSPICRDCANRLIPADGPRHGRVEDGPCPNCGQIHPPP